MPGFYAVPALKSFFVYKLLIMLTTWRSRTGRFSIDQGDQNKTTTLEMCSCTSDGDERDARFNL